MKKTWIGFLVAAICIGCSGSDDSKTNTTGTTGATSTTGSTPPPAETTGGTTTSSANTGATTVAFNDIHAVMNQNCVGCHGEKGKGGIDLRSYESVMKGGDAGPIVVAGDPDNSILVQALRGSHGRKPMPMKAAPLPEDVIAKVEAWIKAGAKNE